MLLITVFLSTGVENWYLNSGRGFTLKLFCETGCPFNLTFVKMSDADGGVGVSLSDPLLQWANKNRLKRQAIEFLYHISINSL